MTSVPTGVPRIDAKIEPTPHASFPEPCWIWTGYVHTTGYGQVAMGGKTRLAHRAIYEMYKGPIPEGLQIDHLCVQTACVNPVHLEAVTALVNVRRSSSAAKKRARTHCKNGHEFTPENTFEHTRGGRQCLACFKEASRKRSAVLSVEKVPCDVCGQLMHYAAVLRHKRFMHDVGAAPLKRNTRKAPDDGTEYWHGTINGYSNRRCRCDDCRMVWNAYTARYRAERNNKKRTPND